MLRSAVAPADDVQLAGAQTPSFGRRREAADANQRDARLGHGSEAQGRADVLTAVADHDGERHPGPKPTPGGSGRVEVCVRVDPDDAAIRVRQASEHPWGHVA